jgi:hypothetical protein
VLVAEFIDFAAFSSILVSVIAKLKSFLQETVSMYFAGALGIQTFEDAPVLLEDSVDPIDEFVGISI